MLAPIKVEHSSDTGYSPASGTPVGGQAFPSSGFTARIEGGVKVLNNRFKVLQVLGEGKQGKVYLGEDMHVGLDAGAAASSPSARALASQVAIKVLQL